MIDYDTGPRKRWSPTYWETRYDVKCDNCGQRLFKKEAGRCQECTAQVGKPLAYKRRLLRRKKASAG